MEGIVKLGKVKDHFTEDNEMYSIKTHVRVAPNYRDNGITNFYTSEELRRWYGDCECEEEYYEKDYGTDDDGKQIIATRHFLVIYANKDFDEEIMRTRIKAS